LLRVKTLAFLFVLTSAALAIDQQVSIAPETVVVPSGKLRLKAFLWKPSGPGPFPAVLFCHGSGGADAAHTAGLPITEAAENLAAMFLKHGYAFMYLFRRGQGLSADQGPFMQDIPAARRNSERKRIPSAFAVRSRHDGSPRRCDGRFDVLEGHSRRRPEAGWRLSAIHSVDN
jgi:hypothetical protein